MGDPHYRMENPTKMDGLGVPPFMETFKFQCYIQLSHVVTVVGDPVSYCGGMTRS